MDRLFGEIVGFHVGGQGVFVLHAYEVEDLAAGGTGLLAVIFGDLANVDRFALAGCIKVQGLLGN